MKFICSYKHHQHLNSAFLGQLQDSTPEKCVQCNKLCIPRVHVNILKQFFEELIYMWIPRTIWTPNFQSTHEAMVVL